MYGLLFVETKALSFKNPRLTALFTLLRLALLGLFLLFILQISYLHSILVFIAFFASFWFIVLNKAARHGSF